MERTRRLRTAESIRSLVRENRLHTDDMIYPLFIEEGQNIEKEIPSMPGIKRWSLQESLYLITVGPAGLQAERCAGLEVRDTGIGIPKDDIPKLFEEFFRASNARRNQIQGAGVGLTAVKNLVERLGGELEVASEENVGSRFTVRLPLCKGMRPDESLTREPGTKE